MVSKKSLKNKVPASNKRKVINSSSNSDKKRSIFVSQKVIINSIFDKSLFEQNVKADLPDNVVDIFNHMLADVTYINETLTKKDYSFYDCNMAFIDGEKMISSKKQALMEFLMQNESQQKVKKLEKLKKMTKTKKKIKIESKSKSLGESSSKFDMSSLPMENGNVDDEKCSELSSENNFIFRPQRKRKKPSKFEIDESKIGNETISESKESKSSVKQSEEDAGNDEIELRLVCSKRPRLNGKTKSKRRPNEADKAHFIDLIDGSSTDGSDNPKSKSSLSESLAANLKSKVYFREPVTRKPSKPTNKRLKEHTLLDKILLGINCVRKWTENGLHLSKLCETDLGLLNKRLTSLDCTLGDLEEHTDENNNRYLSVLLKSDLFSAFILPAHKSGTEPVTIAAAPPTGLTREPNEPVDSCENVSYGRQKSKQHIPAMYRQRHAVPSILSKPSVKQIDNKLGNSKDSVKAPMRSDELCFAPIKFEDKPSSSVPAIEPVTLSSSTEPQLTASQLLRLKSQKTIFDANQKKLIATKTSEEIAANSQQATQVPHYAISNGLVRDAPHPIIYHQPTPSPHQFITTNSIPVIILPHSQFIQTAPPSGIRQIRAPPYHTVTKIQRIPPLHGNGQSPVVRTTGINQTRISVDLNRINNNNINNNNANANHCLPAQSVILKNLLQQTNNQIVPPTAISTDKMMPLSVFQNSKSKRPFVPFNYSINK